MKINMASVCIGALNTLYNRYSQRNGPTLYKFIFKKTYHILMRAELTNQLRGTTIHCSTVAQCSYPVYQHNHIN